MPMVPFELLSEKLMVAPGYTTERLTPKNLLIALAFPEQARHFFDHDNFQHACADPMTLMLCLVSAIS